MEGTSKERKAIPRRDRAYYRRRTQNRIHAALASFFAEEAAAGRITKKQLAELIEKNPAQITRWLSEPSNYEVDTISDILLAMGAEMDPRVVRFSDRGKANYVHPLLTKIAGSSANGTRVKRPAGRQTVELKPQTATRETARVTLRESAE